MHTNNNLQDNIFHKISTTEIEVPNELINKLIDSKNSIDLITLSQINTWQDNKLKYNENILKRIKYDKDINENTLQKYADLTGEIYEFKEQFIKPTSLIRAQSIMKLRDFFLKNLN